VPNYGKDQFMEFSVNLSKLGLDPVSLLGGDVCGSPFNRLVVKTRASASFTAELKDFVAPIDLFLAPRADLAPELPFFCGQSDTITSEIYVTNPHPSSVYTWSTIGGNIIYTAPSGTWITVNQPGTYIVTQRLMAGCAPYATDTVTILRDTACSILPSRFRSFSGVYYANEKRSVLKWSVENNSLIKSFVVEASVNGRSFTETGFVSANRDLPDNAVYDFTYNMPFDASSFVDFRIKMINEDGSYFYSKVLRINIRPPAKTGITIAPNPVRGNFQIAVNSTTDAQAQIVFFDMSGKAIMTMNESLKKGNNVFTVNTRSGWQPGMYNALVKINEEITTARLVVLE